MPFPCSDPGHHGAVASRASGQDVNFFGATDVLPRPEVAAKDLAIKAYGPVESWYLRPAECALGLLGEASKGSRVTDR